jgi:DNA-binding transcriptional MocR family regulator
VTSDWSSGLDLLLGVDRAGGLRNGIEQSLREAMRDGRLALGTVLPSSRSLARDLGVARGTVSAAYSQLAAEGYLISAGLHAVVYLPGSGPSESQIQSRAARLSIAFNTLASYWHEPPKPSPQAIIIGYATPASHAYRPALDALTRLLAQAT